MAGLKRKNDNCHESSQSDPTDEYSEPDSVNQFSSGGRSGRRRGSRGNRGKVTRSGRVRGSSSVPPMEGSEEPETPRTKRVQKALAIEETPRSTRQSTRLGVKPPSNTNSASSTETPNGQEPKLNVLVEERAGSNHVSRRRDADAARFEAAIRSLSQEPSSGDYLLHSPDTKFERGPPGSETDSGTKEMRTPSRKRRGGGLESTLALTGVYSVNAISKKRKIKEETDVETQSPLDDVLEDPASELPQGLNKLEDVGTPEFVEQSDSALTLSGRGRGRGRGGRGRGGRARGRGGRGAALAAARSAKRVVIKSRGRGARLGRGGRRADEESEIERSPSPNPATHKLRERQKELDRAFKKVAAAQRLALAVLGLYSQSRLAKDKNSHKNSAEYDVVLKDLDARLQKRQEVLRRAYELKVEEENTLFEAQKDLIERQFKATAKHIQEEHLLAAQGAYMAFVEGHRHAEDDEHTESDDSDNEIQYEYPPYYIDEKKFKRGYNSSHVQESDGSTLYERAKYGWDDFVQRAMLSGDINPQMEQMDQEAEKTGFDLLTMLLDATQAAEVPTKQVANDKLERSPHLQLPSMRHETVSVAMLALADAAAELQHHTLEPASRPPPHRTLLHQPAQPPVPLSHSPADPRSFLLPRLIEPQLPVASLQPPPSRRILPTNIPPISDRRVLPDLFGAPGGPPPQLPPLQSPHFPRPGPYPPPYLPGSTQGYFYHHPHPPHPPPASSGPSAATPRQHY